jgi:hypothetical protein
MKRFLLTLGVAAAFMGALAAPAGAAESHSVSLAPLTANWFKVELAPGEQYRGTAVLKNLLNEPVNGYLYSVDGFSTPQGGFALAERRTRGNAVGAWAGMPPQRMSLKPKETRMVSFTLKVPGLAEPGDYTGGLVFERDRQQAASKSQASFGLIERVGARIYLTVAGELRPSLTITKLKRAGSRFEMTVLNDGNAHLTPQPSLVVSSMRGRNVGISLDPKPEALYPQQSVTYTGTWSRPGLLGRFRAKATVGWTGGTASRRTSFWLIPWMLILLVLVIAAVVGMIGVRTVRWIRRARRALSEQRKGSAPLASEPVEMPPLSAAVLDDSVVQPRVAEPVVLSPSTPARPRPREHNGAQPKRGTKTPAATRRKTRPVAGTLAKNRRVAGTVAKQRRKQSARSR